MNPVVSTMSSRLSRSFLVALIAAALATPTLHAQAKAEQTKPVQTIGGAFVGHSVNGVSNSGWSGFYAAQMKWFYGSASLNAFSANGETTLANEVQLGYVFFSRDDAVKNDRTAWALTGGYYMPQEGDGMLMGGLSGFSGRKTWPFALHASLTWIMPEVGDNVMQIRGGLGYVF